ncbi:hypothetical protein [Ephemeroptericola cinctiostellae]|nr:hypothetical protein [Ephemeroptericola cinctiostellae]
MAFDVKVLMKKLNEKTRREVWFFVWWLRFTEALFSAAPADEVLATAAQS